jgi:hypothetical protein
MTLSRKVWNRMYSDFLAPCRLELLHTLLESALQCGYEAHSVRSYWRVLCSGGPLPGVRYLILRHDVDTDPETAKLMWSREQALGVAGSYYFRLSTLDVPLMQEIERSGGEASYHYEEIATVAKALGLKDVRTVRERMPYIRDQFKTNVARLRETSGLPMLTVAKHGDHINRKLGVGNEEILEDRSLREEMGIELEAYDPEMMDTVAARCSDDQHPVYWRPVDPLEPICRQEPVVYVLLHPRHWRTNARANLIDDARRAAEGARYALRRRPAPPNGRRT